MKFKDACLSLFDQLPWSYLDEVQGRLPLLQGLIIPLQVNVFGHNGFQVFKFCCHVNTSPPRSHCPPSGQCFWPQRLPSLQILLSCQHISSFSFLLHLLHPPLSHLHLHLSCCAACQSSCSRAPTESQLSCSIPRLCPGGQGPPVQN